MSERVLLTTKKKSQKILAQEPTQNSIFVGPENPIQNISMETRLKPEVAPFLFKNGIIELDFKV